MIFVVIVIIMPVTSLAQSSEDSNIQTFKSAYQFNVQ